MKLIHCNGCGVEIPGGECPTCGEKNPKPAAPKVEAPKPSPKVGVKTYAKARK